MQSVIVVSLLLVCSVLQVVSQNLIVNGNFSATTIAPWSYVNGNADDSLVSGSSCYLGITCLSLGAVGTANGVSQQVIVADGYAYSLSFFLNQYGGIPNSLNVTAQFTGGPTVVLASYVNNVTSGVVFYSATLMAPPGTASVNLTITFLVRQDPSYVYLNMISLIQQGLVARNGTVSGDPQFVGLRGQSFQVHGIDGAVYNIISGSTYQLNARFGFLEGPRACPVMPSTGHQSVNCWSHPGSYLTELGLKLNHTHQILITAGTATMGWSTVTFNGRTLTVNESNVFLTYQSKYEMTLRFGEWTIEIENSDSFINIRSVYIIPKFYSQLSSHGLLGQTWRNKRYSGSIAAIEGEVDDYMVAENSVFGDSFLFNKY